MELAMPTFPKGKQRPWIPKRDAMGLMPQRSSAENVLFYQSKKWKSLRNYYFQMHPLCQECERMGYVIEGKEVDHIKPIRFGGAALLLNNLQTLCKSCHARKSGRESKMKK
jgi:5-methylcytosine-specific restriction endonuclease McrA